jgi:multicomponent K+:H+ antiporter subunit A
MITAASMAGVPLTNGFISKEMFFTELLANLSGPVMVISAIVATLAGIFAVSYSIRLVHGVFFDGSLVNKFRIKMHMNPFRYAFTCNYFGNFMYFSWYFPCLTCRNNGQ